MKEEKPFGETSNGEELGVGSLSFLRPGHRLEFQELTRNVPCEQDIPRLKPSLGSVSE